METEGRNKQRIFHKILTYGAALILCSVVALIVLQLVGVSTGQDVKNESIVLTFIGILATFIVVGNFSQVREVEERMRDDFKGFKSDTRKMVDERLNDQKTMYDDKLTMKIKELKDGDFSEIMKHQKECDNAMLNIPVNIQKYGKTIEGEMGKRLNLILDYLIETYETQTIVTFVKDIRSGKMKTYKIHLSSEPPKTTYNAIAKVNKNDEVEFYKVDSSSKISDVPISKSINKLNDVAFKIDRINGILKLYKQNIMIDNDFDKGSGSLDNTPNGGDNYIGYNKLGI